MCPSLNLIANSLLCRTDISLTQNQRISCQLIVQILDTRVDTNITNNLHKRIGYFELIRSITVVGMSPI